MKKAIWLLLLAFLLACGPSTTETQPPNTETAEDTAVVPTQEIIETEEIEEAETIDTSNEAAQSAPAAANLDDFSPASTVAEAAVVRQQDWRKGAVDPIVVIIEYGDFQ
jgi:hypothetical protein